MKSTTQVIRSPQDPNADCQNVMCSRVDDGSSSSASAAKKTDKSAQENHALRGMRWGKMSKPISCKNKIKWAGTGGTPELEFLNTGVKPTAVVSGQTPLIVKWRV